MPETPRGAFDGTKVVRLSYDADTPTESAPFVNREVLVDAAMVIPTTYDATGLFGFPGYGRTGPDGVQEWVMQGARDELMQHINTLPVSGAWRDTTARNTWRRIFRDLRTGGQSTTTLKQMATDLRRAAEADIAATPPP